MGFDTMVYPAFMPNCASVIEMEVRSTKTISNAAGISTIMVLGNTGVVDSRQCANDSCKRLCDFITHSQDHLYNFDSRDRGYPQLSLNDTKCKKGTIDMTHYLEAEDTSGADKQYVSMNGVTIERDGIELQVGAVNSYAEVLRDIHAMIIIKTRTSNGREYSELDAFNDLNISMNRMYVYPNCITAINMRSKIVEATASISKFRNPDRDDYREVCVKHICHFQIGRTNKYGVCDENCFKININDMRRNIGAMWDLIQNLITFVDYRWTTTSMGIKLAICDVVHLVNAAATKVNVTEEASYEYSKALVACRVAIILVYSIASMVNLQERARVQYENPAQGFIGGDWQTRVEAVANGYYFATSTITMGSYAQFWPDTDRYIQETTNGKIVGTVVVRGRSRPGENPRVSIISVDVEQYKMLNKISSFIKDNPIMYDIDATVENKLATDIIPRIRAN